MYLKVKEGISCFFFIYWLGYLVLNFSWNIVFYKENIDDIKIGKVRKIGERIYSFIVGKFIFCIL